MAISFSRRSFARMIAAAGIAASVSLPLSASAQSVADITKKGELVVGMLVDFPPYGILNASNEPDGYDADVARLLAKDLGVKVKIVPVAGPNRIPFLLTNKVDMLIASLAVTPERAKQVDFSEAYAGASIVLYAPKTKVIKAPADLKGVSVAVTRASTQDLAVTAIAPEGTQIRRFDDDATATQALLSGQVDAIGASTLVVAQIAKIGGKDKFETKFLLKQQYHGIALRPGNAELLARVNKFVADHKADGELNKLHQKWLGVDLPNLKQN